MFKSLMLAGVLVIGGTRVAAADDAVTVVVPALPSIPVKSFSIADNGAPADGTKLATTAIQKTIDACVKAGGGTVTVPAGNYVIGPLKLGSNLELHLDKGAVLAFSANRNDIPVKGGKYLAAFTAKNAHDISITGEGTIEGNGAAWWKDYARAAKGTAAASKPAGPQVRRPVLFALTNCNRVLFKDVNIANSPSVHISFSGENLTVDHVHFTADEDSANTDGIDISGRSVMINNSTLDVGEDNIAIRPTGDAAGDKANCQDITITDCSFLHGKGLSVGGTTLGGLKNFTVRNCTFNGTQNGIRLRSSRTAGGTVDGVVIDHVTMKDVKTPLIIQSYYPTIPANAATDPAQPVTNSTPVWKNIRISDVTAEGGMAAGHIVGLAEQPVTDVTFTNVRLTAAKGLEIFHAKNVHMESSRVFVDKGPAVIATDAEISGIDVNKEGGADALP